LLDATYPSPAVSAKINSGSGGPQSLPGQSESPRKLSQSIQQQQIQQKQLLLQQQQIGSHSIKIHDFSPSKHGETGGVKMLICLDAQSDIRQHATGRTIIYVMQESTLYLHIF